MIAAQTEEFSKSCAGRSRRCPSEVKSVELYLSAAAIAVVVVIIAWIVRRRHVRSDEWIPADVSAAQRRFVLILLRRSSANLTAQALENAARKAWIDRFGPNPGGTRFVESGERGAGFVLQAHGNAFLVMETKKGIRQLEPPLRIHPDSAHEIWEGYSDDVSIGVAYNHHPDPQTLGAYVATLAAALADAETLGVLHAPSRQLWRLDPEVIMRLSNEPAEFFAKEI